MIKREFKVNLKSFIIWTSILIIMFLVVFLIYPYIITDDTIKNIDEMIKMFPQELLKAFNMDIASLNSVFGWLKSEGFMFVLLIIGFYSSMQGGTLLLKEENDKTIEYLESLPVKRNKIVTNKIVVGIAYIILMTLIIGLFNYVALLLSGDFNQKQYLILSVTPILIGLPFFTLNLFISTFLHKTMKVVGISLGMVFVFYVFSVLSELSTNVEILKYFSLYTLADTRNVIANISINPLNILISLVITCLFITLTYFRYNEKELI
jgi:ABC-2 type transport system permease protein